jgi:hypothetical protein
MFYRKPFLFGTPLHRFEFVARNATRRCENTTMTNEMKSEVTFYQVSGNRVEYRYELNKLTDSSSEPRLILLLIGRARSCVDWWIFSVGERILFQMRSSGYSILAICLAKMDYLIQMPIQENSDVKSIYHTLQMWMNEIYSKHFHRYPLLYLFGIIQGSRMGSLLCRVLPIQGQILYIYPGYRPSLLIRSDYGRAMQDRFISDPTLAHWFYFDFCFKNSSNTNDLCPFSRLNKNYFNPVPPTYFVHVNNDPMLQLSNYIQRLFQIFETMLFISEVHFSLRMILSNWISFIH